MRGIHLVLVCSAGVVLAADGPVLLAQSRAELGFTTSLSKRSSDSYARQFGAEAHDRLETWKRYAAERKALHLSEAELLRDVNRTLNRIRFVEDATHWVEEDYW